jgi:acetylornithine deacetylase/succinyl-diaminopimelate desuccinylase-like protein
MTFDDLRTAPARFEALLDRIEDVRARPYGDFFGAVEHMCHLRDIEAEGYAVRIRRLLSEDEPLLHDLDGAQLSRDRNYLADDPRAALRSFAKARAESVAMLERADAAAFERAGTLENAGRVTLAKIVQLMREHDAGHARELTVIAALDHYARHRARFREELEALCRVPGISASDPQAVRASAEATKRVLEGHGITGVRLLEVEGAHPSVYGEVLVDASAPTLLIYAHHDVQPPGKLDRWNTPPFEPVERDGRLYARGASDDKAGVMAHVAAAASYRGAPPCNLKFFIEGEEEIGSPNLHRFLERDRELLRADAVVLADTPNFDTGVPTLTYRLRGMCQVDVEVRCLERPLHSGRGAGAVPDAVAILCQLIASLSGAPRLSAAPIHDERFARDAGLLDGVALLGTREQTWTEPAITVIGFDARPVDESFNQIAASARARLSIRTVPGGEDLVERVLALDSPHARVTTRVVKEAPWWITEPTGPVFDAARRALAHGYEHEVMMSGSGGTIGFVGAFAEAFEGTPLLLMGVEDPPCNAHSENESLHLGDWEKCIRSSIFLYDEVAHALR